MYQRTFSDAIDAKFVPVETPPPAPAVDAASPSPGEGLVSSFKSILSRVKLSELSTDDLLLAAILYFTLRESGDDDLLLILAGLFLTGFFDR